MKKILWIFPSAVVLLTPWFHRLAYENIMLAVPNISQNDAQGWALGLLVAGAMILLPIYVENSK